MSSKECEKDICDKFNQLIETDDKFESNLTKIYCDYVLSLNKIYVDRIVDGYYEQCENYLKEYSSNEECENSSNEELEKQFIKSYESNLALKGKEICAKVETFTNNELLIKKAVVYCEFVHGLKDVDRKLVDKCDDYIYELNNFYSHKNNFFKINHDRKDRQECKDMRNMILK